MWLREVQVVEENPYMWRSTRAVLAASREVSIILGWVGWGTLTEQLWGALAQKVEDQINTKTALNWGPKPMHAPVRHGI